MLDSSRQPGVGIGHWKDRLEDCPQCSRDLVQPSSYEPLWGDRWLVTLDCPNCAWHQEGVWPHEALRRFEDHLDAIDDQLWEELLTLERNRIEQDIEAFAGALSSNAILPEDF